MFVGLGAFGLLVRFWCALLDPDGPRPKFAPWRVAAIPVALLLVLLHVVAAPLLLTVRATAPLGPRELVDPLYLRVPFDKSIEGQDLVVVNPPIPFLVVYCLVNYEHEGLPVPRAVRALAPGNGPMTVTRTDDRTIEVEPHAGYLGFPDRLFRNEQHPLRRGEEVRLPRMTASVLSTEDSRPKVVAFRFSTPLEDPSIRWLRFRAGQYVPWTPPPAGEKVVLKPEWGPDVWW
jgi:hypothetical protein